MKRATGLELTEAKSTGVLGREIETFGIAIAHAMKVYRGSRERD